MNQFEAYLGALTTGQRVRVTQTNGQVWEGTIVQNDGTDALQLQVSMTTVVRYRAIDSLTIVSMTEPTVVPLPTAATVKQTEPVAVLPITASVPDAAAEPVEIAETAETAVSLPQKSFDPDTLPTILPLVSKDRLYDLETNEEVLKELTDSLPDADKARLRSTVNSLLADYEEDDQENICLTAEELSQLSRAEGIHDTRRACQIAAAGFYLAADYQKATETLYYGNQTREAYLTAYNASYRTNEDIKYHRLAAAMATLYLLNSDSSEHYEEAAACLRDASLRCKDISGVEYLSRNLTNDTQLAYCYEVIKRISDKAKVNIQSCQTIGEMLALLKEKYTTTGVVFTLQQEMQKKETALAEGTHPTEDTNIRSDKDGNRYDTIGSITKLNFFEDKGKITGASGKVYDFEFNDILDTAFRRKIKSMAGKNPKNISIPVSFDIDTSYSRSVAINVASRTEAKAPTKDTGNTYTSVTEPDTLFTNKQYAAALAGFQRLFTESKPEEAFCGCVKCYLAFCNLSADDQKQYLPQLKALVEKYADTIELNMKTGISLYDSYTKLGEHFHAVEVIDKMLAADLFKSETTCFHYMNMKANALRRAGDLRGAIEALKDLVRYVDKMHLYERKTHINNSTYVDIAENYMDLGDYQQARYCLDMAGYSVKREELRTKLQQLYKEQYALKLIPEEPIAATDTPTDTAEEIPEEATDPVTAVVSTAADDTDTPSDDHDNSNTVPSDTADEATDIMEPSVSEETEIVEETEEIIEYTDDNAFGKLIKDDKEIVETALSFAPHQLECLITYLAAAAYICRHSRSGRLSSYLEIPLTESIVNVSELVNAAFNAHGFYQPLSSSRLMLDYLNACDIIPDYSAAFFTAAALRAMFADKALQSFEMERLTAELERITPAAYRTKILSLTSLLHSFKTMTGYSMDVFADYNTRNEFTQAIIRSAEECRAYIDGRVKSFESQGRLRRARELIFHDKESIIADALDVVCDDDIRQLSRIKRTMTDTFMRNEETLSVDNVDVKKLDLFIDTHWDHARDEILSEKKHVNRPYDNLKGGRRNNIIVMLKRAIDCICQWVNASESAEVTKDVYSLGQYTSRRESVLEQLYQLERQTEEDLSDAFNWGLYSVHTAIAQMREKMEGTYQTASEKYMYINFLRTNHVLLDEDYIPDITATFSDLDDFHIFARIKAYAAAKPTDWTYRIQQIFSDNIHNNNFRSAELIYSYGEAVGDKSIVEHPLYERLEECIRSARKRTAYFYQDFKNELELDESYGSISDVTGYKTFVAHNIDAWYSIAIASGDFGFFSDLMDVYRQTISNNAEAVAIKLMKQLDDLAHDPSYDFGIYSVQQIRDHIEDRNFAIAENILNCIRRSDTKTITDFTQEPKSIFDSFMAEYDALYRAVSDTKITLQKSLTNYYGKHSIEIVLRKVTNNMNKDVRGGIALINNWPVMNPAGEDKIARFISLLGFTDATVTKSTDYGKDDVYTIRRAKRTGKLTYPHPIPAFGSLSVEEGLRVLVLYGRYDTDRMIDKFHEINTVAQNTIVILDSVLNQEERRRFARKIKEEKSFARSFIVIDRVLLFYPAKHYQSNTISRMLMATTMPFSYNQPYCPKPNTPLPGELFTGRTEELRMIEAYDGVNLVYGGRQLGKSSLLHQAAANIDHNAKGDRAIVINIRERNYTEAARYVSQELVLAEILPEGSECDDWDTLTMHIKKRLKDESATRIDYLLLMLDEADEFIGSCQELNYRPITSLKSLNSPRFKFVLAGLHNLSKYDYEAVVAHNSDISHLESVVIRPFRRPEATELLTHALSYLGFVFDDDVINLILAKTNYFPGLIHLYAQKLLMAMTNDDYAGYSETDTPYYYVTESHIKKVLADQGFKDQIKDKLYMTLKLKEEENSPYYIIALILAYLYYEAEESGVTAFTADDVISKAKSDEINVLLRYSREQIKELMHEMWDLNILSAKGDCYMFSTEAFRELLGTKADVNSALSAYMGGNEA